MPSVIEERDILIVGAGVAGLCLAIRLKEKGFNPLLIEKQVGVRNQLKGEFFQPKGVELLAQLKLLNHFPKEKIQQITEVEHIYSHPLFKTSSTFSVAYSQWKENLSGFVCLHEDILLSLRAKYASLQGDLREGLHISDLDVLQNSNICTLSSGNVIKSKVFVGADGRYSLTRKMAEMPTVDMDCDRVMMATLMPNVNLKPGIFYTEEVEGGVLYAFKYKSGLSRVYVCFLKEELAQATSMRESFFLNKISKTKLFQNQSISFDDPILFMPTLDTMMVKRSSRQAVWIGDAAGVVDPLAGYGLTLCMEDAVDLADVIQKNIATPHDLPKELSEFSLHAQKRYLHARYIGLWVALLFMGRNSAGKLTKWRTLTQVNKNLDLKKRLIALLSGFDTNPFHIHDIPYYLGFLPNLIHETIDQLSIIRKMGFIQNYILTTPFEFKKSYLKKKVRSVVENALSEKN